MRREMIILVDNGHGINTKGKKSPDGRLMEYAYTREVAQEVVRRLRKMGYDARRIVPEETDVTLARRVMRVNQICQSAGNRNVILVSIHCNAAGSDGHWHNGTGWEAWTSPGSTQGDQLATCLYDAARKLLPVGCKIRTDRSDGDDDKEANFTILMKTLCAACLTENLFQDNKKDVDFLLSKDGFNCVVQLHVDGIVNYINNKI